MEAMYADVPVWMQRGWIPIAGDGCGSYYLMPSRNDFGPGYPVIFCDHVDGLTAPTYIVASDLWHFIDFYLREDLGEERWPFDRDFVTQKDPLITAFHGVALPWKVDA
ncbi:MAG: hypothetical protein CHACPFDD_01251 [Phycisphaerae bacterium]|nr:hypothetical protein [Phycisphaerae bacterium]